MNETCEVCGRKSEHITIKASNVFMVPLVYCCNECLKHSAVEKVLFETLRHDPTKVRETVLNRTVYHDGEYISVRTYFNQYNE
jgi:ribosome-binding protein aMBF1 (putative translation factor)